MKLFSYAAIVLGLVIAANSLQALPYGLTNATAIGAYLNGALPSIAPNSTATYDVTVAYTNLVFNQPLYLTSYPHTNLQVVIEKAGVIRLFPNRPDVANSEVKVFLDISSRVFNVSDSSMTCIAFHPEFGQSGSTNRGYVYITYKWRPNPDFGANADFSYYRLSRFTVPDGTMAADPNSEVVLLEQFDQQEWHDSGCLMFGQDGYLYFGVGDEGGANDQYNVTQIINQRMMSGVFRIDVNRNPATSHPIRMQPFHHPNTPAGWPESFSTNYFIPNDNPFVNVAGTNLEEYYGLGFRNPYRFSQDPVTGRIWVGDVGQDTREEVDTLLPGRNYQWAYMEGIVAGPKAKPSSVIGIEQPPLWDYPHANGDGCIIGGYVYRGTNFPGLEGKYIAADNDSGRIWALASADGVNLDSVQQIATMPPGSVYGGTSSCGLDANGEIYFVKIGGVGAGQIYKLKTIVNFVSDPASPLSQLGLFTNLATLAPAPGFHSYTVNSPLWSDGAVKQRWLAVPNNGTHDTPAEQIVFSPTNEWKFPPGTVFAKHFDLPVNDTNAAITQRVETRLLVVDQNGAVYGLTYKWRPDGSDADLLATGTNANFLITEAGGLVRTQMWSFPSRSDCLVCHNANAGYVLGVKTHQLNCPTTYPETGVTDNQLRALGNIGLLGTNYSEAQLGSYLKSYSVTNTSVSLELRVRSYIDANCSQCHRPGGVQAYFDARYITPLSLQGIIQGPAYTFITDTNDRVVVPQDLPHSLLYNRANRVGQFQMPPLAKNVVDTNAMLAISSWINSLPPGPGVILSVTANNVTGPFTVQVRFSTAVIGLTSNKFQVANGQVTALTGNGANYTLTIAPLALGNVTVRLPAGQVQDSSGETNYDSNVLSVNYSATDPSLITWLQFDEGNGSVANDSSPHGNSGMLFNMDSRAWVNGLFGGALSFNGIDNYVSITNVAGGDFTLSCWIKSKQVFPVADNTYEGAGIIWADVGGTANDFIFGGTRSADGIDRLSFFTGNPDTSVNGETEISTGQWVHLAATRSGATGQLNVYVDGQLDATGAGGTNYLNANPVINIGGNTLDGRYFLGLIDDVRIYSRVLSPAEITGLYQLYVGPALSRIADLSIPQNSSTGPLNFTVTNGTTALTALTLTAGSSNPALVPTNNIIFGGTGSSRTVTVTPLAGQTGATVITINISDGQLSASQNFKLAVNAVVPSSIKGLLHRWSFNDTNDSVGNAGLTLVGNATLASGRLVIPGDAAFTSYASVNLTNDLATNATLTVECWFTMNALQNWSKVWMFGQNYAGGEPLLSYINFTPVTGQANNMPKIDFDPANANEFNTTAGDTTPELSNGQQYHAVAVFNAASNTMSYYVNGVLGNSASMGGYNITNLNASTFRFGCGFYYGDPDLNGSINELRIWNVAFTASNVVTSFQSGPDAVPNFNPVPPAPVPIGTGLSGGQFILFWPAWASNYNTYVTTNLASPIVWSLVTNQPQSSNGLFYLNISTTNAGAQFFRLSQP